jgi:peptide/nickel transport system substrate-binding protein
VAALVLALATACTGGADRAPAASRGPVGGTLRVGMVTPAFFGMDPRDEWNSATWELFRCCLVRTLVSYDVSGASTDLRPVPDLASAPPTVSTDGLTWTFRLRTGMRYAPPMDDVTITSADFVRALTRAADIYDPEQASLSLYLTMIDGWEAYARGEASSIVGLQTPDPQTLRIVTTRPGSSLLYLLALPLAAPIPPLPGSPDAPFGTATGFEQPGQPNGAARYGGALVASGPYMIEGSEAIDFTIPAVDRDPVGGFTPWVVKFLDDGSFRTPQFGSISFVRNPSWQPQDDPLRAALADRIEIEGGEHEELFGRMEAGELDLVFDESPPPDVLRRYQDDVELRPLIQTPAGSSGVNFAVFNLAMPPFDDLAVRRAVAFAVDRDALRAGIDPGLNARIAQHFASDTTEASLLASWAAIPGTDGRGDIAAARDEMRASRYAAGTRCTSAVCRDVPIVINDAMAAAIPGLERSLRGLGIDADVRAGNPYDCLDPEALVAMCIGQGWSPDFPSAENYLGAFFGSDGALPSTKLGSSPGDLRGWGYSVTQVRRWIPRSTAASGRSVRARPRAGHGWTSIWSRN